MTIFALSAFNAKFRKVSASPTLGVLPAPMAPPASIATAAGNVKGSIRVSRVNAHHYQSAPLTLQNTCRNLPFQSYLPTPIKAFELYCLLLSTHYYDSEYIKQGFTAGFSINYKGIPHTAELPNHRSLENNIAFINQYLTTEIINNRIAGPFSSRPRGLIISPLGLVPKEHPGNFRVIHDLSRPRDTGSINSGISDEAAFVSYQQFDYVAKIVSFIGRGCLIAKADIKNAYRIIPVSPDEYYLLGFKVQNCFYYDKVLTMGCRSSCQIFERFSTALQHILQSFYHVQNMSHYLDDFIFMGASHTQSCLLALNSFIHLASRIGLPIKQEKTVYPSTKVVVHGILLDTIAMTAALPSDKLTKLKNTINDVLTRKKLRLRRLLSVIGLLSFASKVTPGGRPFIRRLIDLTCGIQNLEYFIRITASAKLDLQVWKCFLF